MTKVPRNIDILLVEDNLGDIKLITDALADTDARPEVCIVRDGYEAMQLLRKRPPYEHAPQPSLVLLDLNLPRKDGRTVLSEIKSDPDLAIIPVVVFSGSDAPQDILACYELHANSYIVKPRDLDGMIAAVISLVDFWLTKATLPPVKLGLFPGDRDEN